MGKNPTDRGKPGTKISLIVDEQGSPLGAVLAGANVPDSQLLEATLEAIVVERPEPTAEAPQYLCLDKGYDNPTGREAASSHGHTPHRRGEDAVRSSRRSQAAALGGGTHAGLAQQVPRDPDSLRQA